jgi:predicted alternative tryptophan synthase beta-subunit
MTDSIKYVLDETHIPKYWYNLIADLPSPPPPVLHPGTLGRSIVSGARARSIVRGVWKKRSIPRRAFTTSTKV